MHELIRRWREQGQARYSVHIILLSQAADELERAWHDDRHNGEWQPEICEICVKEMAEQERSDCE